MLTPLNTDVAPHELNMYAAHGAENSTRKHDTDDGEVTIHICI